MPAHLPLLYGLHSILERLSDSEDAAPYPAPEGMCSRYFPPLQVFEDEDAVYVRAVIPGASLADISLVYSANMLVMRGNLPAPEGTLIRRERLTGPFRREVRMPCKVLAASINARMCDGLLTVVLPKDPAAKKRAIPVSCSEGSSS